MMPVIRFSAGISNRSLIGRKRHVVDINLKCLISFRPSSESNLPCELELSIFKPKLRSRVHLRSNLIDTGIAICSPSVPTTFSDASNLDLATINGFVKRMLDDAAISGEEVFLYRHLYILYRLYYIIIIFQVYFHLIEDNEFAINVSSFDKYMFANNAIFSRKCYPYTPSYFMKGFTSYVTKKRENYRGENSRCSPQAIFRSVSELFSVFYARITCVSIEWCSVIWCLEWTIF